ncbi:Germin-like protein subfamily 1 member 1 [Morella rubra]|uniref:Germin-like protein n=1 Tax=Morella rubra TaxID=262757 RepID=A0A6A1V7G5_9ROSI|nr:Germin-like protein subfamily 1 member 1 [Morella rubra]
MNTSGSPLLQLLLGLALILGLAKPDPDALQDYCIADNRRPGSIFTNDVPCIDPARANSSYFATSALSRPGNTGSNQYGSNVTLVNTVNLPGLNTMGLTMARIDIAADGIVPLHSHPRASEVTICLKGELTVGFMDTSNRQYTEKLRPGDSFVFPKGLVHFIYNRDGKRPAVAVSGFNSQDPGTQLASMATFASKHGIPDAVLKRAFRISNQELTTRLGT